MYIEQMRMKEHYQVIKHFYSNLTACKIDGIFMGKASLWFLGASVTQCILAGAGLTSLSRIAHAMYPTCFSAYLHQRADVM